MEAIRQKWNRVQGALWVRAEAMQLCIEATIQEYKEELEKKYETSLEALKAKQDTEDGENEDRPAEGTASHEAGAGGTNDSQNKRKQPTIPCEGIGCQWKLLTEGMTARVTKVNTKGAKCPHCSTLQQGIEYAIKAEATLFRTPDGIAAIIDTTRKGRNGNQLRKISEICHELNRSIPEPNTSRARHLIQEPLRYMARRIANTLLIELPTNNAGFDATLMEDERRALRQRACMTCRGCDIEGEQEGGNRKDQMECEEGIARLCKGCGHLQRRNDVQPIQTLEECPCCTQRRHTSEGLSRQPCQICICRWTIRNYGTRIRQQKGIGGDRKGQEAQGRRS